MGLSFAVIVFNNAASGCVKALQHIMYGPGAYQSCDLAETNYAELARSLGCVGVRVGVPVVFDVVVTRDAARMLPAIVSRAVQAQKGDRLA